MGLIAAIEGIVDIEKVMDLLIVVVNCFYLLWFALSIKMITSLLTKSRLWRDVVSASAQVAKKGAANWYPEFIDIRRSLLLVQQELKVPSYVDIVRRHDISHFSELVWQNIGMFMGRGKIKTASMRVGVEHCSPAQGREAGAKHGVPDCRRTPCHHRETESRSVPLPSVTSSPLLQRWMTSLERRYRSRTTPLPRPCRWTMPQDSKRQPPWSRGRSGQRPSARRGARITALHEEKRTCS